MLRTEELLIAELTLADIARQINSELHESIADPLIQARRRYVIRCHRLRWRPKGLNGQL